MAYLSIDRAMGQIGAPLDALNNGIEPPLGGGLRAATERAVARKPVQGGAVKRDSRRRGTPLAGSVTSRLLPTPTVTRS